MGWRSSPLVLQRSGEEHRHIERDIGKGRGSDPLAKSMRLATCVMSVLRITKGLYASAWNIEDPVVRNAATGIELSLFAAIAVKAAIGHFNPRADAGAWEH